MPSALHTLAVAAGLQDVPRRSPNVRPLDLLGRRFVILRHL